MSHFNSMLAAVLVTESLTSTSSTMPQSCFCCRASVPSLNLSPAERDTFVGLHCSWNCWMRMKRQHLHFAHSFACSTCFGIFWDHHKQGKLPFSTAKTKDSRLCHGCRVRFSCIAGNCVHNSPTMYSVYTLVSVQCTDPYSTTLKEANFNGFWRYDRVSRDQNS